MKHGGVILTTYGTCTADPGALGARGAEVDRDAPVVWIPAPAPATWTKTSSDNIAAIVWDVVVLDEGHKIKNPSTQV